MTHSLTDLSASNHVFSLFQSVMARRNLVKRSLTTILCAVQGNFESSAPSIKLHLIPQQWCHVHLLPNMKRCSPVSSEADADISHIVKYWHLPDNLEYCRKCLVFAKFCSLSSCSLNVPCKISDESRSFVNLYVLLCVLLVDDFGLIVQNMI